MYVCVHWNDPQTWAMYMIHKSPIPFKADNAIMQSTRRDREGNKEEDLHSDCDPRPVNSIWREDAEPPVADQ